MNARATQVPIAIVGAGALMPGSDSVDGFWRDVVTGRDLVTEVPSTHWRIEDYHDADPTAPDKTYGHRGAFLSPVDFAPLDFGVPPNTLSATDTTQLLSLLVAEQVFADVGLDGVDRERVSVILGTGAMELLYSMSNRMQRPVWLNALRRHGVAEPLAQAVCDSIAEHYVPWQEATFPGLLSNVVAGRIANRFDLHGTNHTVDAACASSLAAITGAVNELTLGRADMALAGGVDTLNDIVMFMCFSKTPALSASGDCRPFSAAADGTVLGEGLVMVALKRLADAERDGDQVYAVLRGIGSSSDGRAKAIYAPVADGQARALRRAYDSAGYGPDTVELVEAHGTGTRAGDAAEFQALRTVFTESGRDDDAWCAFGSLKSQFGHTKSAAGAAGLLKAALALHHKVLPPTIKVDRPNPDLDLATGPLYLNSETRPWIRDSTHPRRASVSSFGFGGSNFHVTLEEFRPTAVATVAPLSRTSPSELILLSADSEDGLRVAGQQLLADSGSLTALARRSQRSFRPTAAARLAVVATSVEDLVSKLDRSRAPLVHRANGDPEPGAVAYLFPGQGSQYVGMGADLAMHFPAARAVWDRVADVEPLHRVVFPVPGTADADETITATEWAQPALAAASLAALAVLTQVGLRPEHVAGHSLGELVALHVAGAFDADTLIRLARRRGELMRDAARVPGAMLAVPAGHDEVAALVKEFGHDQIWIANHNGPKQTVVSGERTAITELANWLVARQISATALKAAAAFHSPLVSSATGPLRDFLATERVAAPSIPVHGNADADTYPADPDLVRQRVADHLSAPVRFVDQVESMYARGVRTFVEVGAGTTLTTLVGHILAGRPHLAVSVDAKSRDGVTALHEALGRLAVHGVELDFEPLWEPYRQDRSQAGKPGLAIPIMGTNYGKPSPILAEPEVSEPMAIEPAGTHDVQRQVIEAHQEYQRQASEAHAEYQRLLAESHRAFLAATQGGPLPEPVPVFAQPVPLPEPPAVQALPAPEPVVVTPAPAPEPADDLAGVLLGIVADKTGYPVGMLDTDMALEADLGIDSIKRVEILSALRAQAPDLPAVDTAELGKLRTLADILGALDDTVSEPEPLVRLAVRTVPAPAPGWAMPGLYDGQLVITGDDTIAQHLAEMLTQQDVPAIASTQLPEGADRVVFLALGPDDTMTAHRRALTTARAAAPARMFVTVQDTDGGRAWLGGFAALARTAAKEWPDAAVKAIDCQVADRAPEAVAAAIVDELLTGGDTLDVVLRADGTRLTVRTEPAPLDTDGVRIGSESVIVATGGARGVTAAGLVALARRYRPRIALLGRTALVDEPEAVGGAADETAVRERVLANAATPAEVRAAVSRVMANREIRATIAELEAAGAVVGYHAVDVRDATAVRDALAKVRAEWGPITTVVHGAGVLADKHIADKTDEQFDLVFGTKVLGLRAVLDATENDPVTTLCLFSSITATEGNAGQADYAMANEVLNHVATAWQAARSGRIARAVGWGPWQGGMVDAGLAEHFRQRGMPLIPLAAGADAFVAELGAGGPTTVLVLAGDGPPAPTAVRGQIRLTDRSHPELADHAVAGRPVLPLVMALEWFAGASPCLRDVRVLRRIEVQPDQVLNLVFDSELRLLDDTGRLCYRATAAELGEPAHWPPADLEPFAGEVYDGHQLFHGPAFQAIRAVHGLSSAGATGTVVGAAELGWRGGYRWTDPVVLDGGLQLAVLWAARVLGTASLPMSVAEFRVHHNGSVNGEVQAVVRGGDVIGDGASCDIALLDAAGRPIAELVGVGLVARPR